MNANKIGRNAPCPCGSGKKYKRCCGRSGATPTTGVLDDLKATLKDQEFGNLEEAQAFAASYTQQANAAALDDFDGLSPEQMAHFLNAPLGSPDHITFAESGITASNAPIMILFNIMADTIGEDGIRTTAKGYLPRALCQNARSAYPDTMPDAPPAGFNVNREADFHALHITRNVAELAGLIRKYKGRFLLTRKAQKLRDTGGIHPALFQTFATKFNWAYSDGYPDLHHLQHSFAFSLYLIHRHGATQHAQSFYEDAFMRAFPMVLDEIEPRPYQEAEHILRHCYTLRVLERFAGFLGLVDIERSGTDILNSELLIRKTPLFDATVQFKTS